MFSFFKINATHRTAMSVFLVVLLVKRICVVFVSVLVTKISPCTAYQVQIVLIGQEMRRWARGEDSKDGKTEKKKEKKNVTSHICPDHPRSATCTKVGIWGGVPDVVNNAKFRQIWIRGFGSLWVKFCHFLMLNAMAYTKVE